MREFKFRIWDNRYNRFIRPGEMAFDIFKFDKFFDHFVFQQYTGLKDKNGKEIYEGDFIKYEGMSLEYPFIGVVKFQDCAYVAFEEYTGCRIQLGAGLKLEIVGNVFENPKLSKS